MSLAQYKKKRDFNVTPEPTTATTKKESEAIFVVQRHKASRLHYDFRLEMKGMLKAAVREKRVTGEQASSTKDGAGM